MEEGGGEVLYVEMIYKSCRHCPLFLSKAAYHNQLLREASLRVAEKVANGIPLLC